MKIFNYIKNNLHRLEEANSKSYFGVINNVNSYFVVVDDSFCSFELGTSEGVASLQQRIAEKYSHKANAGEETLSLPFNKCFFELYHKETKVSRAWYVDNNENVESFIYTQTEAGWAFIDYRFLIEQHKGLNNLNIEAGTFIAAYLRLINEKEQKVSKESTKMTIRKHGKTREIKIKPVVFLTDKKYVKPLAKSKQSGSREFSHRFEVSGHWRSIKGLGKTPEGEYSEIGRTWVNDCIKGQGDLVKKTRVRM